MASTYVFTRLLWQIHSNYESWNAIVTYENEQSEIISPRCITHENPVVVKLSTVDR